MRKESVRIENTMIQEVFIIHQLDILHINNIGLYLKEIREIKKLKQKYVAIQTKVSQTYLSQIESNKRTPSLQIIDKLIKYYNCNLIMTYYESKSI